jgi:prepilin-type N-terminal cleavage/methylation domain-containing protein
MHACTASLRRERVVRYTPRQTAFTLLESLVVLAIIGLLAAIAAPSWWGLQSASLEREGALVLERLVLLQARSLRANGRYASEGELPTLEGLSNRLSAHYTLKVDLSPRSFLMRLIPGEPGTLSELSADHLGRRSPLPTG